MNQQALCSLDSYMNRIESTDPYFRAGRVLKSQGLVFEAYLPGAALGSRAQILSGTSIHSEKGIEAEVIGFKDKRAILMPYEEHSGVHQGSFVVLKRRKAEIDVSPHLLGHVLDGTGKILGDESLQLSLTDGQKRKIETRSLYAAPAEVLSRNLITEPLDLGVRAINGLLTLGKGQRVGIMAGSGVGKSVLLGMMARNSNADINVIALIGERGREVREFIERDLGEETLKRSVVIVATSDKSPLLRVRAAFMAATIAEYFRDQGSNVLLMMDSVTRFCMAQREIGLSLGEPPSTKGYTPSVFSMLPKLLERAGTSDHSGSITGLYTVLVEGDDMEEPIADAARSILDGHLVLTRKLAQKNHFPAIDVLQSTSRVMRGIISQDHLFLASRIRELMATYKDVEDLIQIGAYAKGTNLAVDQAVAVHDRIRTLLRQSIEEPGSLQETLAQMMAIVRASEAVAQAPTGNKR